jgi:hypothetical protein
MVGDCGDASAARPRFHPASRERLSAFDYRSLLTILPLDLGKLLLTQDQVGLIASVCALFVSASEVLHNAADAQAAHAKLWEVASSSSASLRRL